MEIDLSSVGISGTLPTEIGFFVGMNKLVMGKNNIFGSIPSSIGSMSSLTYLDLGYNGIVGPIPSSIGALTKLAALLLMFNRISSSIPSSIGSLGSLKVLYAEGNTITGSLPSTLGGMTSLNILSLYENGITGVIPANIGNMKLLDIIYLDVNSLSGTIPASMRELTALTTLTLQKNFLTMGALDTVPPSTFSLTTQQSELNISANCLGYVSLYKLGHNTSPVLSRCKCKIQIFLLKLLCSEYKGFTLYYVYFDMRFCQLICHSLLSFSFPSLISSHISLSQSHPHGSQLRSPPYSVFHPVCL